MNIEILSYQPCVDKINGLALYRIVLTYKDENTTKLVGRQVASCYLEQTQELFDNLDNYFKNPNAYDISYKTTDNIATGKTKITKLIFDRK